MPFDSGKPEPPSEWSGEMLLRYPDGEESSMDTDGIVVRPGEPFPGKPDYVLQQLEVRDRPRADGKYMVVGIRRQA